MYFFLFQYVTKNNNELHQRAVPKQRPLASIVDESDNGVDRRAERIPTIGVQGHVPDRKDVTTMSQPEELVGTKVPHNLSVSNTAVNTNENPHVLIESEESKEARLDRQWKMLKVEMEDLPSIYAKLAKIKLTGRV